MNNETQRKITSLTLMTIMLAGGMTVAFQGMEPAMAATNSNLFVSVEDSAFDNTFAGPMVVEVVVADRNIGETNELKGEPTVTVNGEDLRMMQGTDGNWYAYIADKKMADAADATVTVAGAGTGLDFGTPYIVSGTAIGTLNFESAGVYFPNTAIDVNDNINNVVRSAKALSDPSGNHTGQHLGFNEINWPFIQTFDFTVKGDVNIVYRAAGSPQESVLKYTDDNSDQVALNLDRDSYPKSASIHLVLNDQMLNIDPTSEDSWTFNGTGTDATYYQYYDRLLTRVSDNANLFDSLKSSLNFEQNGKLIIDPQDNVKVVDNDDQKLSGNTAVNHQITFTETSVNTGVFENTDSGNKANFETLSTALRGTASTIDYNDSEQSILIDNFDATVNIIEPDDEWQSGEQIKVDIIDQDVNKNTRIEELAKITDSNSILPTVKIGEPITFEFLKNSHTSPTTYVEQFSDRYIANVTGATVDTLTFDYAYAYSDFYTFADGGDIAPYVFTYVNYDFTSLTDKRITIAIANSTGHPLHDLVKDASPSGFIRLDTQSLLPTNIGGDLKIQVIGSSAFTAQEKAPMVLDILRFGVDGDKRYNDAIYRMLPEETTKSSGVFQGSLEYVMLNQINVGQAATYAKITTLDQDLVIIAHEDLTDEDDVRVNYLDLEGTGTIGTQSDQVSAPSHSGKITFDDTNYKVGDTVNVTLEDSDLNTDTNTLQIYKIAQGTSIVGDKVLLSDKNSNLGNLLEIKFADKLWNATGSCNLGFEDTNFTLRETKKDSGVFVGNFQIPQNYCDVGGIVTPVSGLDITVDYIDFRDASGEIIEVGDSAAIGSNTGSVSLDRSVYPVPFGIPKDFGITETSQESGPNNRSIFPIHDTSINNNLGAKGKYLTNGDLKVHIRVNDPDFDLSANGSDDIALDNSPVTVSVIRGSEKVILATAGGKTANDGLISVGNNAANDIKTLGPMKEVAPDAGIFEIDMTIRYTDGPSSTECPKTTVFENLLGSGNNESNRFNTPTSNSENYCIIQGDILQVEYIDPTDASGDLNSITDSATFDLRNGVLQSDKSVYIIGSDMIMTLIEPDFDLDNDQAETISLDLIEWDSDASKVTMGKQGDLNNAFDPEPSAFRETGDSTGIFQVVAEMPSHLDGTQLERGEIIDLEYVDWGPSGAKFVGDEDEDVSLTIFTSNFGATVELDQKVYSWTDKVYITIVSPDHNFDSNAVDEIGNSKDNSVDISTRTGDLDQYKLVETGTDTGIFTGEVILTGFRHDADGDASTGTNGYDTDPRSRGNGPTGGYLEAKDDDGLSVSFESTDGKTVVGSALIRWNVGEVQWLEASYPASGTGVIRTIDPDMNLNPESVDNFKIQVYSDSDAGGIELTVTETNEATGIFEGTVFFTVTDSSSGGRLRVSEGDTVTAKYLDNTLPAPYNTSDELAITATTLIGTLVPPLERAPAANLRTMDAFKNSISTVSVDQQVQIGADLSNGQDRVQEFAYLVQVQNDSGVTVSLAWITGTLVEGQQFSPALSWIPEESGTYTVTAFVWESVDNPTALSPPISTTVNVS